MIPGYTIPVQLPFEWEALLAFLRARATPGVEHVTDSAYVRTIDVGGKPSSVSVTYSSGELKVRYGGDAGGRSRSETAVRQIFRPEKATSSIESALGSDSRLAALVARQRGLRVPGGWSNFEIAVRAVLGQQISVSAATTLMGRLVRLSGSRLDQHAWLFPDPQQVLSIDFRKIGIPEQRARTLEELARFYSENEDARVSGPKGHESLLAIRGVGEWTAGYILMRTSPDEDHWPVGILFCAKHWAHLPRLQLSGSWKSISDAGGPIGAMPRFTCGRLTRNRESHESSTGRCGKLP